MRYRFLKNVTVEGTAYIAGAEVDEAAIPRGSLTELLRLGFLEPIPKANPQRR